MSIIPSVKGVLSVSRKNFKVLIMILAFLLVGFGFFLLIKVVTKKKKPLVFTPMTEGQVLNNTYIIQHEQKIKDDAVYDEYLDWCKFKGELPVDKIGFDEYRMKEYQLYKKLLKSGIAGMHK